MSNADYTVIYRCLQTPEPTSDDQYMPVYKSNETHKIENQLQKKSSRNHEACYSLSYNNSKTIQEKKGKKESDMNVEKTILTLECEMWSMAMIDSNFLVDFLKKQLDCCSI